MTRTLEYPPPLNGSRPAHALRGADFFCGIGGFHQAARNLGLEVVFASDIDEQARRAYSKNYGLQPKGDITFISPDMVMPIAKRFGCLRRTGPIGATN